MQKSWWNHEGNVEALEKLRDRVGDAARSNFRWNSSYSSKLSQRSASCCGEAIQIDVHLSLRALPSRSSSILSNWRAATPARTAKDASLPGTSPSPKTHSAELSNVDQSSTGAIFNSRAPFNTPDLCPKIAEILEGSPMSSIIS